MRRIVLIILAAFAVVVIQAGFVTALPAPASYVDLPLVMVVALITAFRFTDAYVAAFATGIAADALSSLPFGMRTFALLAACTMTVFLFTRVFTHHSWQGNIALHMGAFGLSSMALLVARLLRSTFAGFPLFPPTADTWWNVAFSATYSQLILVILVTIVISSLTAALSKIFIFRPHAR